MTHLVRIAPGMPVAAAITLFLFLGMMTLISVEYRPEPAIPDYVIDIFPVVEPIDLPPEVTPDSVEPVEPPPSLPAIETNIAAVDAAPYAVDLGGLPQIAGPEITTTSFLVPSDADEAPRVRIEPTYPARLLDRGVEGRCVVQFDLTPDGIPVNVRAECTNGGFESASERAVERWRYSPRRVDGMNVARTGMRTTLIYAIED